MIDFALHVHVEPPATAGTSGTIAMDLLFEQRSYSGALLTKEPPFVVEWLRTDILRR
ncbi:MAG: hypothetical protein OXP36_07445 [Gammaproteobacteria bacterium]|nr:hypothetical protein [Gammaproteobacteria bacterium]